MMTTGSTTPTVIEVTVPEPFSEGWDRLDGVAVDGGTLRIDPVAYFYRYDNPTWLLCDWDKVRQNLLDATESPDLALEQRVLDYVRAHGRPTGDPAEVLATAWQVYAHLFRDEHLTDPGLAHVDRRHLRILREVATVMALNRVELTGEISNIGPAWFFADTAQVVFGLDQAESEQLDELYHGGFFNESRRVDSIKAHAALGGRLVHGCQSSPNMSGGVVAPYGLDVARFAVELAAFKDIWRGAIHAKL